MREAVIVSTARTGLAKSWKGALNMTHGATMGGGGSAAQHRKRCTHSRIGRPGQRRGGRDRLAERGPAVARVLGQHLVHHRCELDRAVGAQREQRRREVGDMGQQDRQPLEGIARGSPPEARARA